jgi:hypothetical protein
MVIKELSRNVQTRQPLIKSPGIANDQLWVRCLQLQLPGVQVL